MGDQPVSLMVECEVCHKKFSITADTQCVTHKRKFDVNGRSIYLTYYDCPECGNRHFVQIDDDKSLAMLDINKEQFVHNAALKTRGQKLRKKKVGQYKDTQKHLMRYRTELMKEFDGTQICDGTNVFELRFSV